jgi:hypothetical protein
MRLAQFTISIRTDMFIPGMRNDVFKLLYIVQVLPVHFLCKIIMFFVNNSRAASFWMVAAAGVDRRIRSAMRPRQLQWEADKMRESMYRSGIHLNHLRARIPPVLSYGTGICINEMRSSIQTIPVPMVGW